MSLSWLQTWKADAQLYAKPDKTSGSRILILSFAAGWRSPSSGAHHDSTNTLSLRGLKRVFSNFAMIIA